MRDLGVECVVLPEVAGLDKASRLASTLGSYLGNSLSVSAVVLDQTYKCSF